MDNSNGHCLLQHRDLSLSSYVDNDSFGIFPTSRLEALGIGRRQRERKLADGSLKRIAKGWFASPGYDTDVASAISVRGRLTCVDALRRYRVWVPPTHGLHVRVSLGAGTPRDAGVVAHRTNAPLGTSPVDDAVAALECAFGCLSPRDALIVAESAVNKGLMSEAVVLELGKRTPYLVRRALRHFDARAQSGTETVVRYEFARRGIRVCPQVEVPGVGWVDMIVGDCLIVECDSKTFHLLPDTHSYDRERDLEAMAQGYLVVRLSYEMVMFDWESTWRRIERLLDRKVHLDTARSNKLRRTWTPDPRSAGARRREWARLVESTRSAGSLASTGQ